MCYSRSVETDRYSRQILFKEIGENGQKKLRAASVALIGCGALGASHAESLTRAGVARIKLIDRDFVEFSNLQRQTLYTETDAIERVPKAVAAKNRLTDVNSDVALEAFVENIDARNIEELIADVDLVVDGSDNFQVRYLVNDACVKTETSWIYGAAVSSYGSTMTIRPGKTACLRCIFEDIPAPGSSPTCDTAGVIQPIISMISALQVAEALKLLTGNTEDLHNSLIQLDVWATDFRKIRGIKQAQDCITCVKKNFEFLNAQEDEFLTTLCGRDAVQIKPEGNRQIDFEVLRSNLPEVKGLKHNEYLIRFEIDHYEFTVFKDSRAIIKGTNDVADARSAYSRYIGN